MSYIFDGNDHIDTADNAVAGIDVASFSWSACIKVTSTPGGQQAIVTHATSIAPGNFRRLMVVRPPGTAGWRFGVIQSFNSNANNGDWEYQTDLALNTWYQVGVDYDSVAANDPVIRINGSAVTTTEVLTPTTPRFSGEDSIRFGEDLGGTSDLVAKLEEVAFWNTRLSAGDWTTVALNGPSSVTTNRVYYIPFRFDAVDQNGATGTLTVTGATLDTGDHALNSLRESTGRGILRGVLRGGR